jgi:hypothetical protein
MADRLGLMQFVVCPIFLGPILTPMKAALSIGSIRAASSRQTYAIGAINAASAGKAKILAFNGVSRRWVVETLAADAVDLVPLDVDFLKRSRWLGQTTGA